jgi:signal transduction histidine kinase
MTDTNERIGVDELRSLFLFEALDEEKLRWLAENGRVEAHAAGTEVLTEGEPGTCFFVLLQGTVTLSRLVHGDEVEMVRTEQRGVYAGGLQAYLTEQPEDDPAYTATLRAITDTRFFVMPAKTFSEAIRRWFPLPMHLIEGVYLAMRNSQVLIGQRERLLALGALSAGLTHELNNPAAAAVRATAALRERVAGMRHKLAMLADGHLDTSQLPTLVQLQEAAAERVGKAPKLSALEASDAEEEVGDWLEENDVRAGWDIAPVLVAGGIDVPWLGQVAGAVGETNLEPAVRWLAYTVETETLMGEIEDAVARISTLVGAAKQYSQMDRAPFQVVDVHDLLDSTLVMLARKIGDGITVVKEYDRSLPRIPAYAAELNQVWTNIIDNAVAAMEGHGTLTVRTVRDGDLLCVEIADTGPGIPESIRTRIFEPFFTTKPVGEGTGLGLDISYRIVVNKHHGDIRLVSSPGDTRFRVLLPLTAGDPASAAEPPIRDGSPG